jgi:hypothetical protein
MARESQHKAEKRARKPFDDVIEFFKENGEYDSPTRMPTRPPPG